MRALVVARRLDHSAEATGLRLCRRRRGIVCLARAGRRRRGLRLAAALLLRPDLYRFALDLPVIEGGDDLRRRSPPLRPLWFLRSRPEGRRLLLRRRIRLGQDRSSAKHAYQHRDGAGVAGLNKVDAVRFHSVTGSMSLRQHPVFRPHAMPTPGSAFVDAQRADVIPVGFLCQKVAKIVGSLRKRAAPRTPTLSRRLIPNK